MRLLSSARVVVVCVAMGVPAVASAQDWTGGYVSGHIGVSMIPAGAAADNVVLFDTNLDDSFNEMVRTAGGANAFSPGFCAGVSASALPAAGCTVDDKGPDGGVRGGYDWQTGAVVVGVGAELAWPDHTDSVTAFSTTPAFYTFTRELDWLAGFRGRAGVVVGPMLAYGTGGAAWAKLTQSFTTSNAVNTFVENADDMSPGYQLGGGVEIKLGKLSLGSR